MTVICCPWCSRDFGHDAYLAHRRMGTTDCLDPNTVPGLVLGPRYVWQLRQETSA